jgi:hypothetical protein
MAGFLVAEVGSVRVAGRGGVIAHHRGTVKALCSAGRLHAISAT